MASARVPLDDHADPAAAALFSLAAGLLRRVDDLTDRLVTELTGNDEQYARGDLVPRDDLWRSCHDNLEQVIGYLVAPPEDAAVAFAPAEATGHRRAEQGFPLENLLHAYRVGGRLIWQGLLEEARTGHDRDVANDLLEGAARVWDVIDAFSSVVGDAYRERQAELERHDEEQRLLLIDGLLEGRAQDVGFARRAAAVLDLPGRGPYVVVVLRDTTDSSARPPGRLLPARWRLRTTSQVAIVPLDGRSVADVLATLRRHVTGPVGVSPPVADLAHLGQAHQWAETAAATAGAQDQVALLDDHLPAALLASEPLLASRLRARLEERLTVLDDEERQRLLDTVDAFLAADLSTTTASERLFCHRNTVRNRLRQFEELTRRRFDRVDDLVEIVLARAAARLQATPASRP